VEVLAGGVRRRAAARLDEDPDEADAPPLPDGAVVGADEPVDPAEDPDWADGVVRGVLFAGGLVPRCRLLTGLLRRG
jgi:hypothetical protein